MPPGRGGPATKHQFLGEHSSQCFSLTEKNERKIFQLSVKFPAPAPKHRRAGIIQRMSLQCSLSYQNEAFCLQLGLRNSRVVWMKHSRAVSLCQNPDVENFSPKIQVWQRRRALRAGLCNGKHLQPFNFQSYRCPLSYWHFHFRGLCGWGPALVTLCHGWRTNPSSPGDFPDSEPWIHRAALSPTLSPCLVLIPWGQSPFFGEPGWGPGAEGRKPQVGRAGQAPNFRERKTPKWFPLTF